jgi:hypothetical protein
MTHLQVDLQPRMVIRCLAVHKYDHGVLDRPLQDPHYCHPPKAYRAPLAQGQSCAFRLPRFCPRTSGDSGYESERIVGDSTLSLGYAIADLTATTPLTTSAGLRHHRKHVNIQSAHISKINTYEYHTVNSCLCQRRVFQTESTTNHFIERYGKRLNNF